MVDSVFLDLDTSPSFRLLFSRFQVFSSVNNIENSEKHLLSREGATAPPFASLDPRLKFFTTYHFCMTDMLILN